jgi:hypothetical protein
MNNIEDYQNLVELLKQALLFYSNENNYPKTICITGDDNTKIENNLSQIEIDKGSQARFALSKINEINIINQKMLDDYVNISEKMLNNVNDNIENNVEVQELLKSIKELNG